MQRIWWKSTDINLYERIFIEQYTEKNVLNFKYLFE